jgi:hypothetical protein
MANDYRAKRNPYVPKYGNRKAIFIFESPPKEGAYFYDTTNTPGKDQLFNAMMRQILGLPKQTKVAGLRAFADAGYLLIDATYTPVNDDNLSKSEREARAQVQIKKDFDFLCKELTEYSEPDTKVIVGMKHVCNFLVPMLKAFNTFNILNTTGRIVPLPLCGNATRFGKMVRPMLGLAPLEDT